jgi:surface antigen
MIRTARLPLAGLFFIGMATTTLTAGCTNQPYSSPQQQAQNACQAFGPKTLSGAAIGALGGGAAGAGLGAIAGGGRGAAIGAGIGALTGLIGGLAVGHNLDMRDCAEAQQALAQIRATPTGSAVAWRSPTGSHGSYTPVSDEYRSSDGQFCRSVRQDTALQGYQSTTAVVATCRTPDGNYQTVQPLTT